MNWRLPCAILVLFVAALYVCSRPLDVVAPDGTSTQAHTDSQTYLHKVFAPEVFPNWILVVVGIGGVAAALFTLTAIKRQADLQSVPMQQWVEIENWRTSVVHENDGGGVLTVSFDVFNRTPYVFTLNEAHIKPLHHYFKKKVDYRVGPNKKVIYDAYFPITREQNADRGARVLQIPMSVIIEFTDVLKNKQYHSEVGTIECNSQRALFTPKGFDAVDEVAAN
jgi:hypothetical protein